MNFGSISIERLIVHRIFQRKKKQKDCSDFDLKNELIETDEEVRSKIVERIAEACNQGSKALELEIADTTEGSFFDFATKIRRAPDENFIDFSKKIAVRLAEKQTRTTIPDGYLLIIDAVDDNNKSVVVVIKAELQDALRTTSDKKLELVKDLFLSPAIKFFKIGVLFERILNQKIFPNNNYGCILFDDNFSSSIKLEPAEYFYKDFLGFSVDNNEPIKTKQFYLAFLEFLNKNVSDYREREELTDTIKSYYRHASGIVDPSYLAENYVPENLRSTFQTEVSIRFPRTFVRNTSLMKENLAKRKLFFIDDVSIVAPESVFEDNIDIINPTDLEALRNSSETNYTLIKIKGRPYPIKSKK